MEKIINYDNLRKFAYVSDKLVIGKIKAIMLDFMGLGGMAMHDSDFGDAKDLAKHGIVVVKPYYNPWCWMNKQAVDYTDEIVDVVINKYDLKDVKIISTGLSMGGLCALVYCAYSKHKVTSCIVNCPVCDLVYHYTERNDLPRTLYSAYYGFDGTLEEALKAHSPYHIVDKLPKIPYIVFHCNEDNAVSFEKHALPFKERMINFGHNYKLYEVEGRGHVDLSPYMRNEFFNTIIQQSQD